MLLDQLRKRDVGGFAGHLREQTEESFPCPLRLVAQAGRIHPASRAVYVLRYANVAMHENVEGLQVPRRVEASRNSARWPGRRGCFP